MSKITNDGRLNLVWHGMLYSCTNTVTVGVKGLKHPLWVIPVEFHNLSVTENKNVTLR